MFYLRTIFAGPWRTIREGLKPAIQPPVKNKTQKAKVFNFQYKVGAEGGVEPVADSRALSKVAFQVNGFGGAEVVRAEKMNQLRIIPVHQGVYFLYAKTSQVIYKFID